MISKHIGISLELANVWISPDKVMKKQPWCWRLTSPGPQQSCEGTHQASKHCHSPAIPFPHCWLHGHLPPLRTRQVWPECSELSLFYPAWHYYASDFIWMHKHWQVVAKLWRHQKQWVNSSWISIPSSADRYHGSSKGCIPLWWWCCPGKATGMLCIPVSSFGLISAQFSLSKMLFINKKAFPILYLFFCYKSDCLQII